MANLTLSHPAEPRSTVPSETTILVAASVVAWFAIVAVLGARGGFVTPSGVPPLPILLGVLTPLAVFFAAYLLSRTIRDSCWRSTLAS
jgi:ABC-type multidrug transport system permease subunit